MGGNEHFVERGNGNVSDGVVRSALRELQALLAERRLWLTFAAVVLLFAFTGPFGTYERLGPAARLGYWLVLHAAAWLICLSAVVLADRLLVQRIAAMLARMAIGALAATPLIGAAVIAINAVMLGVPPSLAGLAESTLTGLPITALMCLLSWLTLSPVMSGAGTARTASADATSPGTEVAREAPPPRLPRLLRRLDPQDRGPVLHLRVEDHYVHVATTRGRGLVLMRFSDALEELDGCAGLKVHRSHWVADRAVERLLSEDGRLKLVLTTGETVPISRTHAAKARRRYGADNDRPDN